jgi:Fe/S biogenesis protein NfuA
MMAGVSQPREPRRPVLTVTAGARSIVGDALAGYPDPASLSLWVDITGAADGAFTYDIYFRTTADADIWDAVREDDGVSVVVPQASIGRLQGAVLDVSSGDGGLVLVNPNLPPAPPPGGIPDHVDLSDPLAQRVVTVLESLVNPSIAVHGGRADLVAVEDLAVYLRLSGGCQGCGMAKATLSEGIEVMLREAIPELTRVVDVTDHDRGANPYYEPALG